MTALDPQALAKWRESVTRDKAVRNEQLGRATPQPPADELHDVIKAVAKELDGRSFSQTKVREGNSDVWRYIGDAEALAKRVREVATATPQHSVTEQAQWIPVMAPCEGGVLLADSCSDCRREGAECALPSKAATQPEQASIKTWQERAAEVAKARGLALNGDSQDAMKAEIADLRAALAIPASTAASEQQASVSDADIERAALKHVAPGWKQLAAVMQKDGDYQQTEQFRRLKAFAQELSGRATIPSEADERASTVAGYSIKHSTGHGWIIDPPQGSRWIAFDDTPAGDFMAALTHRASTATPNPS